MQRRETRTCAGSIELDGGDVPLVLASADGVAERATPVAFELMQRLSICDSLPRALPPDLWRRLDEVAPGQAVEWRPPQSPQCVLGCSRYSAKAGHFILMREVSDKLAERSLRLQSRHMQAIDRLVASVAHELRSSLSSIVYGADFLELAGGELTREALKQTLKELAVGSRRLQLSVDSVLDHARLGPRVSVPVSLTRVLERVRVLMRNLYGASAPRLHVEVPREADCVRGNPLSVEQIFANLLSNAAESQTRPARARISAELELAPLGSNAPARVRVRIWNDGPTVPLDLADAIFEPFFTTKAHAAGLGLTQARAAAEALDGSLILETFGPGVCFAVTFPASE
jgi:two-component system sensor histidine kinase FlrB